MAVCIGGLEVDERDGGTVPRLLADCFCMKGTQSSHQLTNTFQEIASICQKQIQQNNSFLYVLTIMPIIFDYIKSVFHIFVISFDTNNNIGKEGFLFIHFAGEISEPGMDSFIQQNFECVP